MSVTRNAFQGNITGTTPITIFGAGNSAEISLGSLMFHNTGTAAVNVLVLIVPDGDAAGTDNLFMRLSLGANATNKPNELLAEVLESGATVQVALDVAGTVNYKGWGQTVT